ncbi:hypothetical protein ASE01_12030 [Nocardioides sp. Root190]|uniref:HpcH/HpaI aldolase/citrate lyase family protein n=1 Tax=Nocardioides sp. Root190 TaxID=1736488 RepID=UPI0007002F27|nr:HpcH/HpaI aldolase/citrate lyase family protein [Nocardioides sp. Root190]KRB75787.1 hypothetical protein ASE01_12030 [Nocardioides sp. Root190]
MKHFSYLDTGSRDRLFEVAPHDFGPESPRELLALALGATLYMPGTRTNLAADAHRLAAVGATSLVWCLEDAIEHSAVEQGEANVVAALQELWADESTRRSVPLLFIRIRDADQITRLTERIGDALPLLTGFSLPKADLTRSESMLTAVRDASVGLDRPMYAMPILESEEIAFIETRRPALQRLAELFSQYDEHVVCVRVGGTDLSGLFGLRRDRDTTIWDLAVVRDALADILNQFSRKGDRVVSGAVWEHIAAPRMFKPQLRATPFAEQDASKLRSQLIRDDVDGLMRETSLDKTNGMYGKTVIHPSHVSVVNSLLTVHGEEYQDALMIDAHRDRGGVLASAHGRMNEVGPHARWADQVLARSKVYGVLAEDTALVDLLSIGQRVATNAFGLPNPRPRVVS